MRINYSDTNYEAKFQKIFIFIFLLLAITNLCAKDSYKETITVFKNAGESGELFNNSCGYAVFPTIDKGGFGIGGAYGKGRVYKNNNYVGNTEMAQLTIGFQLGGQAYSQIVFLKDKRAFDDFTNGNFEFSAEASAVAITAGASASATTVGSSAGASRNKENATTIGDYYKGMAVFTVTKGGLMYEASIGGQKFNYNAI